MKSTFAQIFLRSFCKCNPNLCKSARGRIERTSERETGEDEEEEKKAQLRGWWRNATLSTGWVGSPGFLQGQINKGGSNFILFYFIYLAPKFRPVLAGYRVLTRLLEWVVVLIPYRSSFGTVINPVAKNLLTHYWVPTRLSSPLLIIHRSIMGFFG